MSIPTIHGHSIVNKIYINTLQCVFISVLHMYCTLVHYMKVEVIGFSAFNCSRMYNILSYLELNTQMIFCAGLVPCKHPIVYHELGPVRKKQDMLLLSRIMYFTNVIFR